MDINLRGTLLDNDMADIYRWFGWRDITCPSDISDALANAPENEEIVLLVNSPGGDMTVGAEIYSLLRRRKNCRALVQGYAASAATLAMLGCSRITSEPGALLCFHNPSCSAEGDYRELLGAAAGAQNAREAILDLYCARGAHDRQEISDLMDQNIWISPAQALEYGLISEVVAFDGEEPSSVVGMAAATVALPYVTAKMRADYAAHKSAENRAKELRLKNAQLALG